MNLEYKRHLGLFDRRLCKCEVPPLFEKVYQFSLSFWCWRFREVILWQDVVFFQAGMLWSTSSFDNVQYLSLPVFKFSNENHAVLNDLTFHAKHQYFLIIKFLTFIKFYQRLAPEKMHLFCSHKSITFIRYHASILISGSWPQLVIFSLSILATSTHRHKYNIEHFQRSSEG